MPDYEFLAIEDQGGVRIIRLNRPERFNAMVPAMGREYADALISADKDPDIRVAVVTGNGKGFCSGADLAVLAEGPEALDAFVADQRLDQLPTISLSLSIPVVMAVNGPAAGIGMVLALAGDVRFASTSALFISAFSRLGLTAEYGAAWLLQRQVGMSRAAEILLSGRAIDANEALHLGLVHSVSDDALTDALVWAHDVAQHCSPASLAAIKSQLSMTATQSLTHHLPDSLLRMSESFRWPDLNEALVAKKQKRAPVFPPLDAGAAGA
jgi:enoyl-CoA hydratase/carnithine racemase